jgi:hypothetical protein
VTAVRPLLWPLAEAEVCRCGAILDASEEVCSPACRRYAELAEIEMQERAQRRASTCGWVIRYRGFDGPEVRCHERRWSRSKRYGLCREHELFVRDCYGGAR